VVIVLKVAARNGRRNLSFSEIDQLSKRARKTVVTVQDMMFMAWLFTVPAVFVTMLFATIAANERFGRAALPIVAIRPYVARKPRHSFL
jgi:hypothetical protein